MYDRILVPIDLTEESFSDEALRQAKSICKEGGTLILVTVAVVYRSEYVGSFLPDGAYDKIIADIKDQLKTFAKMHVSEDGATIKLVVREGKRADMILEEAQKNKVDLIVMASHKRTGLERSLLGSVASKVMNSAPMPVLVIKG